MISTAGVLILNTGSLLERALDPARPFAGAAQTGHARCVVDAPAHLVLEPEPEPKERIALLVAKLGTSLGRGRQPDPRDVALGYRAAQFADVYLLASPGKDRRRGLG